MRTGYFLHYKGRIPAGVNKKIDIQLNEMRKYFDVIEFDLFDENTSKIRQAAGLIPFVPIKRSYGMVLSAMKEKQPDFVYIRKNILDGASLRFLITLKRLYSACKIIMEIPTYPYDHECFANRIYFMYYFKDVYARKRIHKYVDRIVTYSEDNVIFGITTIKTRNGLVVDNEKMIYKENENDGSINLIAVAGMTPSHGYERIIEGIHKYIEAGGEKKIVFHVVGNGDEIQRYKALVKEYGLSDNVVFYGERHGAELDRIYDFADIGVTVFGGYKVGLYHCSALKSGEYLSKGLPIITGLNEGALVGVNTKYCLQFPNDNTAVDMKMVINFYNSVYGNNLRYNVEEQIHKLAKQTVDISVVMNPIIKYIL